jgi:histone-binding protein RBBP4
MEEEVDEEEIDPGYNDWKKNAPFLYDSLWTHHLEWPTMTVDFLEAKTSVGNETMVKIAYGTHTSGDAPNKLYVSTVKWPQSLVDQDLKKIEDANKRNHLPDKDKKDDAARIFKEQACINHPTEVNRVRHSPHSSFILATQTSTGEVLIFNYSKHPTRPDDSDTECRPEATLSGATAEGYAVEWARHDPARLVSAAADGVIRLWDVDAQKCVSQLESGQNEVPDVACHRQQALVAAATGTHVELWDCREGTKKVAAANHFTEANAVDFSKLDDYLVASGAGSSLYVWDIRRFSERLLCLPRSSGSADGKIQTVHWAPWHPTVLGVSGESGCIELYELSRDEPLFFVHSGNRRFGVSEFAFAPEERMLASADEPGGANNQLQIWTPAIDAFLS